MPLLSARCSTWQPRRALSPRCCCSYGPNPYPEGRRPKEGRNPKAEGSNGMAATGGGRRGLLQNNGAAQRDTCERTTLYDRGLATSGFGFRPSFGLRPSDFGLSIQSTPLPEDR